MLQATNEQRITVFLTELNILICVKGSYITNSFGSKADIRNPEIFRLSSSGCWQKKVAHV